MNGIAKVKNMVSNSGNKIANQFEIETDEFDIFQSYDSIIAVRELNSGIITLDETYWDYSTTTGKYRNLWLNEKKAETQKKIDSGEYKLANLN